MAQSSGFPLSMPTIRFILLMPWGRVGSNLLFTVLRQSSPMKTNNEMFNQLRTAEEQEIWFHEFYETGETLPSHTHIGSKQNLLAVRDPPALLSLLMQHQVRIVRLRRENIVKCAVSQMRAEQYAAATKRDSGVARWAVRPGEQGLGATRLDIDVLLRRIALMDTLQRRLMTDFSQGPKLDIEYEEINTAMDGVVRRARKFLELPEKVIRTPFMKSTPDNLFEAVENFAELRERLAGTPWEAFVRT